MEDLARAAKHYFGADYDKYKQEAKKTRQTMEELYISMAKISIRKCNNKACGAILAGFYFCCIDCEFCDDYYCLCLKCFYDVETPKHEGVKQKGHDSFADNHSILTMVKNGSRSPPPEAIQKKPKGKGLQQPPPPVKVPPTKKLDPGKDILQDSTSSQRSSNPVPSSPSHSARYDYSRPSNRTHFVSSSTDSSHSRSLIPVPNLRGSSHSNPTPRLVREFKIEEGGSIEKLAKIAQAHYDAAPDKIRKSADKFFYSMVKQRGDTMVTMEYFVKSMKKMMYPEYAYPELFKMLVKDRNVGMSITESRTVYYIVLSRRPFCSWCGSFITDVYFCCSKCPASSYALCLHCYSPKAYANHGHSKDNDVFFVDNSLLHIDFNKSHPEGSRSSQEIVIRDQRNSRGNDPVVTVLKIGMAILNAGAAALSILSAAGIACTIM